MNFGIALNSEGFGATDIAIAINFELPSGGTPPTDLLIIPAGTVQGRDGRTWRNDRPQAVVDFFNGRNVDLPIDVEHSTEIKAPKGEPAPAAAWIKGLSVAANGEIHAQVDWNATGADLVANKAYRYYSPVFYFDSKTGSIAGLSSVGLTNKPNLFVPALNREGSHIPQEETMNGVLTALGLAETATEADAIAAVTSLKTAKATNAEAQPSLDKFVPRADYDAAVAKASNAEQKIADLAKARLDAEIGIEIDGALKSGKITPATADFYKASCREEGGLARFRDFVKAAPVIGDPSILDGKKPPESGVGTALNSEEGQKMSALFGNSAEDIAKFGK